MNVKNSREKTLDDFEAADGLDDQVLPPQQAVRLVRPPRGLSGSFTFADLREADSTVNFSSSHHKQPEQKH